MQSSSHSHRSPDRSSFPFALEREPEREVPTPKQGRWAKAAIARGRNSIGQPLLQMATGLRTEEANMITWSLVHLDEHGLMSIESPAKSPKEATHESHSSSSPAWSDG